MELFKKTITDTFQGLTFEETAHKYCVDGKPLSTSVSGCIKQFYEPFDAKAKAEEWAITKNIPAEETLAEWKKVNDESKDRGHRVHTFAENYFYNRGLTPSCPQEVAVIKFWKGLPEWIIPVATELQMYHLQQFFGGTADLLLFDTRTQTYVIADYKTNKDLHKNFMGKRMLPPFGHLLDCPLSHYKIQLSYYQILLEQVHGIEVSRRVVVYLGLDGEYSLYDCEDLTQELITLAN